MIGLEPHWLWLGAAALLAILEIVIPGTFLFISLAAAALLTGLLALILGVDAPFQIALFTLLSLAAVWVGRRLYERNPVKSSDPMLNERTARLIGETVTVVAAIEHGEGRVRVADGVWSARGPDAPVGAQMRVTGTDGNCLQVIPLLAASPDSAAPAPDQSRL